MISREIVKIQRRILKDGGINGEAQALSQLSWMIFLKAFDDKELNWDLIDEKYGSVLPYELRWRNWAGVIDDAELVDFVENVLFPGLQNFSRSKWYEDRASIVRGVFSGGGVRNYIRSGKIMGDAIRSLNAIDFGCYTNRNEISNAYELLLRELQSAGISGEFYTPRAVVDFMVDTVSPELGENIADFACGTGGILVSIMNKLHKQADTVDVLRFLESSKKVIGVEKKQFPHILATSNLLLNGVDGFSVSLEDSLKINFKEYKESKKFDCIIMNPPFGGGVDNVSADFFGEYFQRDTVCLFMFQIIEALKEGGRAAVIVPNSFLNGGGTTQKQKIKEKLLTECNVHTVVRLPAGVFYPFTNIETNLIFFTKGKPTKEMWVFDNPLPVGCKKYGRTRGIVGEDFQEIKGWWGNRVESENARKITAVEIVAAGYAMKVEKEEKSRIIDKDAVVKSFEKLSAKKSQVDSILENIQKRVGQI